MVETRWRRGCRLGCLAAILGVVGILASSCAAAAPLISAAKPAQTPPRARLPEPLPLRPVLPEPAIPAPAVARVPNGLPGWLGVAMQDREPSQPGVNIRRVLRGSPAARAGLLVGDIVLAVNSQPVSGSDEMARQISHLGAGGRALLAVERQGQHTLLAAPLIAVPGAEEQLRMGFVNAPAPAFEGLQVAQGNISERLADLRGQVVILEFWASWCAACRAMMPTLNAWHDEMAPLGGKVVSITLDPLEKASRDAFQLGMRYPVLADPQGQTTRLYQAMALPTLFVLDRKGVVRDVAVGYAPQQMERLGAVVQQLLDES